MLWTRRQADPDGSLFQAQLSTPYFNLACSRNRAKTSSGDLQFTDFLSISSGLLSAMSRDCNFTAWIWMAILVLTSDHALFRYFVHLPALWQVDYDCFLLWPKCVA